jgi:hypothetical protein
MRHHKTSLISVIGHAKIPSLFALLHEREVSTFSRRMKKINNSRQLAALVEEGVAFYT